MALPAFLRLGLTGYPLHHSLSPQLHTAALQAAGLEGAYQLYPVKPLPNGAADLERLTAELRAGTLHGLNITIPHKQSILPLLDVCTERATRIGAVNVVYCSEGRLVGDNSDAPAFLVDLKNFLGNLPGRRGYTPGRAVVLGAGGAARAVVYSLCRDGWAVTVAARCEAQAHALVGSLAVCQDAHTLRSTGMSAAALGKIGKVDLLVNATPVGMAPHTDASPWPAELPLPQDAAVYDLVYNPAETALAHSARQAGRPVLTGLGMLVEQAALAFETWTGITPDRSAMRRAAENHR